MSYHNQEDWVHVDDYHELVEKVEELERQLKVADEDEAWLEKTIEELREDNKHLKQTIYSLNEDIKWLEARVIETEVPV